MSKVTHPHKKQRNNYTLGTFWSAQSPEDEEPCPHCCLPSVPHPYPHTLRPPANTQHSGTGSAWFLQALLTFTSSLEILSPSFSRLRSARTCVLLGTLYGRQKEACFFPEHSQQRLEPAACTMSLSLSLVLLHALFKPF